MGNCQGNFKDRPSIEERDNSPVCTRYLLGNVYNRKDDTGKSSARSSQVIPLSTSSSGRTTPDVTSAGCVDVKLEVSEVAIKSLIPKNFSSDKLSFIPGALSDLTHHYSLRKELRRGHSGRVFSCVKKGSTEFMACKSVCKKATLTENSTEDLLSEIEILRQFSGNSNILELIEVYEDKKAVHLITEFCEEGDLADYMQKVEGNLSEKSVAILFKSMVEAVSFCHSNGVIHRDLKPDNFLLKRKARRGTKSSTFTPDVSQLQVKLADFGFATRLEPGQKTRGFKGTKFFFAPEMIGNNKNEMDSMPEYGFEVDIWALGVVLFVLLSGGLPFQGSSDEQTFSLIRDGHVSFDNSLAAWTVSRQTEWLVKWMLQHDPTKRPTAAQLLAHPWFDGVGGNKDSYFKGRSSV